MKKTRETTSIGKHVLSLTPHTCLCSALPSLLCNEIFSHLRRSKATKIVENAGLYFSHQPTGQDKNGVVLRSVAEFSQLFSRRQQQAQNQFSSCP